MLLLISTVVLQPQLELGDGQWASFPNACEYNAVVTTRNRIAAVIAGVYSLVMATSREGNEGSGRADMVAQVERVRDFTRSLHCTVGCWLPFIRLTCVPYCPITTTSLGRLCHHDKGLC